MKIREFINELDSLYPKTDSAPWDTDGLQCCGDPEREIRRVLVALDAGMAEIECAIGGGYDLLLTHHPMIFGSAGDIVPSKLYGSRIIKLITSGVAAASYHTRLDAGKGGVNDCLAERIGLLNTATFGDEEMPGIGRIGEFSKPMSAQDVCALIKEKLGAPSIRLTGGGTVKRLAVLGGSGKDYVLHAKAAGADAILTGEVSYNAALDFAESGFIVIEGGHYYTEFPVCQRFAKLVRDISGAEADVYSISPQFYL